MSKEKQIEEMAREMCHLSAECETCQICDEKYHGDGEPCYFQCVAKEIINHGYRKQSEGKWIAKPQDWYIDATDWMCSNCKTEFSPIDMVADDFFQTMKFCPNCGAKMKGGAE